MKTRGHTKDINIYLFLGDNVKYWGTYEGHTIISVRYSRDMMSPEKIFLRDISRFLGDNVPCHPSLISRRATWMNEKESRISISANYKL